MTADRAGEGGFAVGGVRLPAPALDARPLHRRDADRQSRRHHAPRARDPRRRRPHRLRGYAGDAGADRPLRHRARRSSPITSTMPSGSAQNSSPRSARARRWRSSATPERRSSPIRATAWSREAIEAGHAVVPIPGPSAMLAALTVAGLPTDTFLFAGFLPVEGGCAAQAPRRTRRRSGDARLLRIAPPRCRFARRHGRCARRRPAGGGRPRTDQDVRERPPGNPRRARRGLCRRADAEGRDGRPRRATAGRDRPLCRRDRPPARRPALDRIGQPGGAGGGAADRPAAPRPLPARPRPQGGRR